MYGFQKRVGCHQNEPNPFQYAQQGCWASQSGEIQDPTDTDDEYVSLKDVTRYLAQEISRIEKEVTMEYDEQFKKEVTQNLQDSMR